MFRLRVPIRPWQAVASSVACLVLCYGAWWFVTRGEPEERIYSPLVLPSPAETFAKFSFLWHDLNLAENTLASLRRVVIGFGLAIVVGVPIGVLCGCFSWVNAFFAPLMLFGRNVPMAALLFLTFLFFHTGEQQKYLFIFFSCVAFIVSDSADTIREVGTAYVDTAYTLGANRRQVILKVLFPLALPGLFNSLRLLFGLAFGYIMLAEAVRADKQVGGLGYLINYQQTRGSNKAVIILLVLIIPIVALAVDRLLYLIQWQLFPYRYGGKGYLHRSVSAMLRGCEDLRGFFFTSATADQFPAPRSSVVQPHRSPS